jgi:hypothetical protein
MATEMGKRLLGSRKSKQVDIPDVGTVTVKAISAKNLLDLGEWAREAQAADNATNGEFTARVIALACFDEAGLPIFGPEDAQTILELPAEIYSALTMPTIELNPSIFATRGAKQAEDPSAARGDSPSGSPPGSESPTST